MSIFTMINDRMVREIDVIAEQAAIVRGQAHDFVQAMAADQEDSVGVILARDQESLASWLLGALVRTRQQALPVFFEGLVILIIGCMAWSGTWIWEYPNVIEIALGGCLVFAGGIMMSHYLSVWWTWRRVGEVIDRHSGRLIGAGKRGVYFTDKERGVGGFVSYDDIAAVLVDQCRVAIIDFDGDELAVLTDVEQGHAQRFVEWALSHMNEET